MRGVTVWLPVSSTCITSSPLAGVVSVKITLLTSAETAVEYCVLGLRVNRSTAPAPSAGCQKRFRAPSRFELKTVRRPSGVHSGYASIAGVNVMRASVIRAGSQTHKSFSLSDTHTTTRPSEELIRGARYARGGAAIGSCQLRQSEIKHLHSAVGSQFDVGWFEIAVNDPLLV